MLKRPFTRRNAIKLATSLAITMGGAWAWARFGESRWVELTSKTLSLGITRHGAPPLRIIHLSDFHHDPNNPYELFEKAAESIRILKPHLILHTGDFITRGIKNHQGYKEILALFPTIAPTYACLGNHDGGYWVGKYGKGYRDTSIVENILNGSGFTLLQNQSTTLTHHGTTLRLTGLGDILANRFSPRETFATIPTPDPAALHIVLSHNPDTFRHLTPFPWHLLLCGHTHGGQIRLPLINWPPYVPVNDRRFIAGLYQLESRTIHVNRGLGSLASLRFNCRPEISLLHIT